MTGVAPSAEGSRSRLVLRPAEPAELFDLGTQAFRRGDPSARLWLSRLTAAAPEELAGQFALAVVACDPVARPALRRALALQPDYTPAWLELASRDAPRALACLDRLCSIDPHDAGGGDALAAALIAGRQIGRARTVLDRMLARDPFSPNAWVNRGRLAVEDGDWAFGLACTKRAAALAPAQFEGWMNLGAIAEEFGDRDFAVRASDRAAMLDPGNLQARWNKTHALLGKGEWRRGFADFRIRLLIQRCYPHELKTPDWSGAPMAGRLLVHDEIGYGDVFNFMRYLPLVRQRVDHVTFEVKPGLVALLTGFPGVDRLIERGPSPPAASEYDAYTALEGLPGLFGTTVETVPPLGAVLKAPEERLERWSAALDAIPGPRVGLCWAGNRASGFDHRRSCRLADLAPLLDVEGVSFVSLQKIDAFDDRHVRLRTLPYELADFADTAAVIANLDLVISVETSVAHLAGAMERPVWILLSRNPAWRWLEHREDSPWYPSARLCRRRDGESWTDLAARVAAHVRARFA